MNATIPTPCAIRFVELAGGRLPALSADSDRLQAVGVFFLLHGIPIGHRYLSTAELPLSPEQLMTAAMESVLPALTDYVLQWSKEAGEDDGAAQFRRVVDSDPFEVFGTMLDRRPEVAADRVSVVICTHERPDVLQKCLATLGRLEDRPLEVIVVDNAPRSDATRAVVESFPGVLHVLEPRMGLSYARNAGIQASRGDIIAFTDDDVEVTAGWIRELSRPFADPDVMCATGLVIPAELETRDQALFERWLGFHRGYNRLRFGKAWLHRFRTSPPVWSIGAGANMAIRRAAFEVTGYFDTRLGAGASGCSEDSEFWYRVLAAGYWCEYTPAAYVLHHHRADRAGLMRQMRLYARGHATALIAQFGRHKDVGNLIRLFLVLPLLYCRRLAPTLIVAEWRPYWLESLRGHIAGLFYWMFNEPDRAPKRPPRTTRQKDGAAGGEAFAARPNSHGGG